MSLRANLWGPIFAVLVETIAPQPGARADEMSSSVSPLTEATVSHPPAPPAEPGSLALELGFGLDAPLGNVGTALVFRPLTSIALLAGIGWHQFSGQTGLRLLRLAIGTRATLFRWNSLAFGLGAGISRGGEKEVRAYHAPGYKDTNVNWTWQSATRLDGELFLELPIGSGSLGVTAGTGWVLTRPDHGVDEEYNDVGLFGDTYKFTPRVFKPYVGVRFSQDFSGPAFATDEVRRSAKEPLGTEDPASGRAFLSPTALIAPAGTWTLGTVAVGGVGVTYAFSDKFEVELDLHAVGAVAGRLKARIGSIGRLALAALAIAGDYGGGKLDVLGGGLVASVCVDAECKLLLSAYGIVVYGKGTDGDEHIGGRAFLLGPSVRMKLIPHLAAFAETHAITALNVLGGFPYVYNVSAGLRFYPSPQWAFEIGGTSLGGRALPIGSITYRTSR